MFFWSPFFFAFITLSSLKRDGKDIDVLQTTQRYCAYFLSVSEMMLVSSGFENVFSAKK